MNDISFNAMGNRHKSRVAALKILYSQDIKDEISILTKDTLKTIVSESMLEVDEFAKSIVLDIVSNIKEIDSIISKTSIRWKLERMSIVDRNILRIGIVELMQNQSAAIVINEAVLLASEFGSENSTSFVNGLLDNVKKELFSSDQNDKGLK